MISYGLGNNLIKTQAIEYGVIGIHLNLVYNGELVILERKINSNSIILTRNDKQITLLAKGIHHTISEFFYLSEGIKPIEMLRKKSSNEVQISFANYMWFSYLRQEELDNNLFYLGDNSSTYKRFASEYVLKILLDERTVSEKEINKEIRTLRETLENIKLRLSIFNEISLSSKLIDMNLSEEIIRKQKEIIRLNDEINLLIKSNRNITQVFLSSFAEKQTLVGKYEAEIRYLAEFGKIKWIKNKYINEIEKISSQIKYFDSLKKTSINSIFKANLTNLELIFFECLTNIGFSIDNSDYVKIDDISFEPSIYSKFGKFKFDYYNLSSGGKKIIFKICYAIAIHIYVEENRIQSLLPKFIIIDTPMKNMSEREDKELYENLYRFFVNLFEVGGRLENYQLIVVDKERPQIFIDNNIMCKHFSIQEPLIP